MTCKYCLPSWRGEGAGVYVWVGGGGGGDGVGGGGGEVRKEKILLADGANFSFYE